MSRFYNFPNGGMIRDIIRDRGLQSACSDWERSLDSSNHRKKTQFVEPAFTLFVASITLSYTVSVRERRP